jgi:hypothetical protein
VTARLSLLAASVLALASPVAVQTTLAAGLDDELLKMMQEMTGGEADPSEKPDADEPGDEPDTETPGQMPTFSVDPAPDKKTPPPGGLLADLEKNAKSTVESYGSYFLTGPASKDSRGDDVAGWMRVAVRSNGKVVDHLFLDAELRGLVSTLPKGHQGVFAEPSSRNMRAKAGDFDILSLTWEQPDYALVFGKATLPLGLSTLFSPADRFQTGYGVEPMQGYKTGVWQARIDYFLEDDVASFAIAPFDNRSSSPPASSRWLGGSGNYYFNALDLPAGTTLHDSFRDPTPDNWSYLAKYKGVRSGFDFFAAGHYGPSIYPVIRQELGQPALVIFPRAASVAAGMSATHGRWEIHGEGIFQLTEKNQDQDFLKYVVGVSYRETERANAMGLAELQPIIEYAGEVVTDEQHAFEYTVNSSDSRPFRDAILGRLQIRLDDEWSGLIGATYNFIDKDISEVAGVEYKYSDNLKFNLDLSLFNGEDGTQFGRWKRNDLLRVGVVWNF